MRRVASVIVLLAAACCVIAQEDVTEPPTTAAPAEVTGVPIPEGACRLCPQVAIQHYEAKACEPVMDEAIDKCCPSSYKCLTETERNIPDNVCLYDNTTYAVGESVPVAGPCRKACLCTKSAQLEEPVTITCAVVECPSVFNVRKPNCRNIYDINECCEVDEVCEELIFPGQDTTIAPETEEAAVTEALPVPVTCEGESGLVFLEGDKMFFNEFPCQYCVCGPDYSGAFGAGCTKVDCGMEYRNREFLRDGCVPLYRPHGCCNLDWICPNNPLLVKDPALAVTGEETDSTHCVMGELATPRGGFLNVTDCTVNCGCSLPPDFTCIRYPNCEQAALAKANPVRLP